MIHYNVYYIHRRTNRKIVERDTKRFIVSGIFVHRNIKTKQQRQQQQQPKFMLIDDSCFMLYVVL